MNFGDLKTTKLIFRLSVNFLGNSRRILFEGISLLVVCLQRKPKLWGYLPRKKKMQRRHCMETTVLRKDSLLVSLGPKV